MVVSVAAGITTDTMGGVLGTGLPLVRAMPNTPALLGLGITGLFARRAAAKHSATWPNNLCAAPA